MTFLYLMSFAKQTTNTLLLQHLPEIINIFAFKEHGY